MLEAGIVALVQANSTVLAMCPDGGFSAELAKDLPLPSWTYAFVGGPVEHTLDSKRGPRMRRLQIDAYGSPELGGGDALLLSEAIDSVLEGFSGPLPDASPPTTGIISCLMEEEPINYFDEAGRTYRRMTEYMVVFG